MFHMQITHMVWAKYKASQCYNRWVVHLFRTRLELVKIIYQKKIPRIFLVNETNRRIEFQLY